MTKDRRPYIAVTNELFEHPKFEPLSWRAKLHLLELWAWCNKYKTDGVVSVEKLEGKGRKVAQELLDNKWVDADVSSKKLEMHDYLKHQKSRQEIEELSQVRKGAGSNGGRRAAHMKWHVSRGIVNPDCELCAANHGAQAQAKV